MSNKKIPVLDAHQSEDCYSRKGEWKEMHTDELKSMKFGYFFTGFASGGLVGAFLTMIYFMK